MLKIEIAQHSRAAGIGPPQIEIFVWQLCFQRGPRINTVYTVAVPSVAVHSHFPHVRCSTLAPNTDTNTLRLCEQRQQPLSLHPRDPKGNYPLEPPTEGEGVSGKGAPRPPSPHTQFSEAQFAWHCLQQ